MFILFVFFKLYSVYFMKLKSLLFYINMVSLKHTLEKSNQIFQNTLSKASDLDYVTNLDYNL